MKVSKLVVLHGRPKTNFVWLGVTKLAFAGPLLESATAVIFRKRQNSHYLSFLYSLKIWTGLKGMASNRPCLNENDVDSPGECIEMDAKQCTLNRDFPGQSNSLDSSGSTRTISISRIAAFLVLSLQLICKCEQPPIQGIVFENHRLEWQDPSCEGF
jgi:hypothetical protein